MYNVLIWHHFCIIKRSPQQGQLTTPLPHVITISFLWWEHLRCSLLTSYKHIICCCCLVPKSCLTLCDPVDWSPPGSSVHGSFQLRILEWVAISSFKRSSWPKDWTCGCCIEVGFLTAGSQGEPLYNKILLTVITMPYVRFPRTYSSHNWKFIVFDQYLLIFSTLSGVVPDNRHSLIPWVWFFFFRFHI